MRYYITENATYEVEAESPKEALAEFKEKLTCPFPTEVEHREIYDANQCDVTAEADDQ